ncbi:DMT family protein [Azospirillaceae bacterium]
MWTILLLTASNLLMTMAWYGHLRFPNAKLWQVILLSWGIAFFEYCLAVPANRIGYRQYSAEQLKVIQEVISLSVFPIISFLWLGEAVRWNYLAACVCLGAAVIFIFKF